MDKQATLGFILIGLVLLVWMWVQAPPPQQQAAQPITADSIKPAPQPLPDQRVPVPPPPREREVDSLGRYFSHLATGEEKIIIIKTDLYTAEITTRGGLIRKWELPGHRTWDGHQVQLVDFNRGGDFSLLFTSTDGKLIHTRSLVFRNGLPPWTTVVLTGDQGYVLELMLPVDKGKSIVKRFTFTNGQYACGVEVRFENVQDVLSNYEYQVVWENGLPYAERNSIDESSSAVAFAFSGGELAELDASSPGEVVERDFGGSTAWVATRNRYFAVALLSTDGRAQGAYLRGVSAARPDQGVRETYLLALKMPLRQESDSARFTIFLGPLDYHVLKSLGNDLDQMVSLGATWIIRPISEYVLIPLFQLIHMVIPNYGLVIIVFSIIIKIALHPLSRSSLKSMKKMQALQPMMSEIREKYKDDPQKMNQQVMNLYRDYGVNPAAGCLPLLLQMPILYALYSVFRSSIELRQASFAGWITDLSVPDVIVTLPAAIPLLGIREVSGLAVAMGLTMFIQQKMTVTDPRQKAMVWMMPVMLTLLFNSFPSGLNLYYFVFNLLSIAQQTWINKQQKDEPLRKVERKTRSGGILGRITKDLPKMR